MNKNYTKAIKVIVNLKKIFDRLELKTPKGLVGEIGELYVLEKLQGKRFKVEHKGGQGGYDILIKGSTKKSDKKVEVKTSRLVQAISYPKGIWLYGWATIRRNQRKEKKFDYLVCVALDDGFCNPRFYIFTRGEAIDHDDVEDRGFSNVKKAIHLFKSKKMYNKAVKGNPKLAKATGGKINCYPEKFLNQWDKIKRP